MTRLFPKELPNKIMQSQTIFNNLKSSDSPFVACREKLLRFSVTLVPYSLLQEFEENGEAFKSIIERAWKQDIQFDARQLFTGDNTNRVKALVFGYQRTNFHMPVYFFFLAAIQNIFRSNSGLVISSKYLRSMQWFALIWRCWFSGVCDEIFEFRVSHLIIQAVRN